MPKAGAQDKVDRQSAAESFDNWFDRELAEIKAGLARLESSLEPSALMAMKARPQPPKPVKQPVSKGSAAVPSAAPSAPAPAAVPSAAPSAPAPAAVLSSAAPEPVPALVASTARPAPAPPSANRVAEPAQQQPAAPPTPPQPTGTDLADPKNFGMMPPIADLERGTASLEAYRTRLARHLAFATKVLHTSRVPAAVWREWRAFEKTIQQRLRELAARPPEPVEQY